MLITRIWKKLPGKYFCVSSKDRQGVWKDKYFKRSELKNVPDYIEDNKDKDLYWCPTGLTKPRRIAEFVDPPKMLWADLDECDPREMEPYMPTIAWESSPGRYHCLWMIDEFVTQEINQRMTYAHLKNGADAGGWDFSQVLRIPGTKNYKYDTAPKVRTMWSDGPTYTFDELNRTLPIVEGAPQTKSRSSKSLYKRYEKRFSGFIRRELMRKRVKKGSRSEVLWRLVNEILEAGCSQEECFELVKASKWNKFAGKRSEDKQLWREINKATDKHIDVVEDDEAPYEEDDVEEDSEDKAPTKFFMKPIADIEEENIDWLWYPYLAMGEVSILEGDPGLGKSYLAQMIGIAVVDGLRLPSPKRISIPQGNVCYFDMENSSGTVTKKRLVSNGIKNQNRFFQEEQPFTIDDEDAMDSVYEAISRLQPKLVVFDTINIYIGKADTHKASETTQAFAQFVQIARRFNCCVLVLRHLNKSKGPAIYRGQGSIAFAGLARVVMSVGKSPEDEDERIMAITKINVAKPPKGLSYHIESLPDTLKDQDRSRFVWGDYVDVTADEMLSAEPKLGNRKQATIEACMNFLEELLSNGKVNKDQVIAAGDARSFGKRTMYEAAEMLGVVMNLEGFGKNKQSYWALPNQKQGNN